VTDPAAGPLERHEVDGLSVLRRRSDEPRATVVLVHGAMDRAASFGRAMRRLGGLDVIAYDRRGYAGSSGAGLAPTIVDHAHDLARVIDWAGATRPVVVGHSLGGTVAMVAVAEGAVDAPALLAFESPVPGLDDSFDGVGGGAVEIGAQHGPEAAAEHFYRLMVGDGTWERLRATDRAARRSEGPALLAELTDLRRRDHALVVREVRRPVIVGVGGRSGDRLRAAALLLQQRLPDGHLVELATAGHGAHLTHPDEFAGVARSAVALASGDPWVPART